MSIAELFKRALVRRLALVLVAILLGCLGLGNSRAQTPPDFSQCFNASAYYYAEFCQTREDAYTGAKAASLKKSSDLGYDPPFTFLEYRVSGQKVNAVHRASSGHEIYAERTWLTECPSGTSWDSTTNTCGCSSGQIKNSITNQCMQSCTARADLSRSSESSTGQYIPNGAIGCNDGCQYMHYNNGDGTASGTFLGDEAENHCLANPTCDLPGWYLSPGTGMCHPPRPECATNQSKDPVTGECKDQCPVGMFIDETGQCKKDGNTCPAGQIKGPDGSCVQDTCPAGQTKGSDGTCKGSTDPDKDDGDEDKYFSGGDNCSAPPACSGDPILCGQARIQWRIDCNTRRNTNISGGSCSAIPVCTGEKCDAMEYAQLLQQWRGTCALEKLAKRDKGDGDDEQPGWTKVDGMSQDPGEGQNSDDVKGVETRTLSTDDLDSGGWLGGAGSCPAIMGGAGGDGLGSAFAQALASPPAYFCNFIGMMAAIVMIGAAYVSAYILAKG